MTARGYKATDILELDTVPTALTADQTHVFVAEVAGGAKPNDTRSKVVAISLTGGPAVTVLGSETPAGVGIAGLATHDGALYFSGASNGPLTDNGVWRVQGGVVRPVAGGPSSPATLNDGNGDGGPALAAAVDGPSSIAFSPSGDLYIAQPGFGFIRVVHGQTIDRFAGRGACFAYPDDVPTGDRLGAKMCSIDHVAVDTYGVVYAAQDVRAKWIVRIDQSGAISTFGGVMTVGGVAIATNGDVLVGDSEDGRILRFPRNDPQHWTLIASGLGHIKALATTADGSIYVVRWETPTPPQGVAYKITRLAPTP